MSQGTPGPVDGLQRRDVLKHTGVGVAAAAGLPAAATAQEGPPDDRGRGEGPPARAVLTVTPEQPAPGDSVTLSGANSKPSGDADAIETYAFAVRTGDGDVVFETEGESATATVTLPSAGEYVASLSVTDSAGDSDETARAIRITFPRDLLNPRARNAGHAWDRGYRGRADRTVLLPDTGFDARHGDLGPWSGVRVNFSDGLSVTAGADSLGDVTPPDSGSIPELVGWLRAGSDPELPRDTGGHGSHCAGIMTGTGRARVLDTETLLERWPFDEESSVGGDPVEREVVVPAEAAGRELFVAIEGRWLDVSLVAPDGSVLASGTTQVNAAEHAAGSLNEDDYGERTVLTADAVHDPGAGEAARTYRVVVAPNGNSPSGSGELRRGAASVVTERGTALAADGDVKAADVTGGLVDDGAPAVHPGVAPRQSVVATPNTFAPTTGTSPVLQAVADDAARFVEAFEPRAISMSWGQPVGAPTAAVQTPADTVHETISRLARAGLVSCHAVANLPGTPTGGNDTVSGAPEAVSVVRTDHLSGIGADSSGGLATVSDDGEVHRTPDVCAYGQRERSVQAQLDTEPGAYGSVGGYTNKTGTSMAAPSTAGLAALVMQAMEEDGPAGLELPAPSALFEAGRTEADRLAWTLRAKATLLATATTTAFNALPWHGDQQPTYAPGQRDPFEGFGRLNHGAAVDAVSRNLAADPDERGVDTPPSEGSAGEAPPGADGERDAADLAVLGLGVPDDEQAAAGYITGPGDYEIDVAFEGYAGRDADLTTGAPHLDVVVYDARSPAGVDGGTPTGTPTIVAETRGVSSPDATLSVSLDEGDVYQVVVKLVSVPGDGARQLAGTDVGLPAGGDGLLFNGADVRATIALEVDGGASGGPDEPDEADPEADVAGIGPGGRPDGVPTDQATGPARLVDR